MYAGSSGHNHWHVDHGARSLLTTLARPIKSHWTECSRKNGRGDGADSILYSYTVQMIVYQMRERGQRKHPAQIIKAGGVKGWLHFRPAPLDDYSPVVNMQAFLTDGQAGPELLLCLTRARLRIDGVMQIAGTEYFLRGRKGRADRWRQSWLCVPEGQEAEAVRRISLIPVRPTATGFVDDED